MRIYSRRSERLTKKEKLVPYVEILSAQWREQRSGEEMSKILKKF